MLIFRKGFATQTVKAVSQENGGSMNVSGRYIDVSLSDEHATTNICCLELKRLLNPSTVIGSYALHADSQMVELC